MTTAGQPRSAVYQAVLAHPPERCTAVCQPEVPILLAGAVPVSGPDPGRAPDRLPIAWRRR